MKTNCPVCRKTSVNLLHKESGTVYCVACGSKMSPSVSIVNQLAKAGLFLPADFFQQEATPSIHTPSSPRQSAPAARTPGGRMPADPVAAAAARRAMMQQQVDNMTAETKMDGGRPSFRGSSKVSREQAAADKEAIKASLRAQAESAYEPIRQNTAPPDISEDLRHQGFDVSRIEREIDPD